MICLRTRIYSPLSSQFGNCYSMSGFQLQSCPAVSRRIFSVYSHAYLDFEYYQLHHSLPPCASYSDFFKFISVAAPGLSYSTWVFSLMIEDMWNLASPSQVSYLGPLLGHEVLDTWPLGSPSDCFIKITIWNNIVATGWEESLLRGGTHCLSLPYMGASVSNNPRGLF